MKLGACVVVSFDFEGRLSLNLDGDFVFVTIWEFESPRGADIFASMWLSCEIDGIISCFDLNIQFIKVLHFMRQPNNQSFTFIRWNLLKRHYLNRSDLLKKPFVIIPRALILWVRKESVLERFKILLDVVEWDDVRSVVDQTIGIVEFRHQFSSVVPSWVVREVLLNHTQSDFAFFFHQSLLMRFPDFNLLHVRVLRLHALSDFKQLCLDDPESIVPTVEISFVHFHHFLAEHNLSLQDLWLFFLAQFTLKSETFLYGPLSLMPKSIAFGI